ncbi:protein FAM8A1-like isoform X1 [Varroa destructor]|uniref:RDD domain-containing protein n=1 Tax=Varroa destructor TaxID=109461 RepID=A0A7M7J7D8_VARDE|nr:protein FAM8A1-like isoform X1 [Varroa destructor]XP_022647247.1 protein FAM8A1-like isoform X1 [Varroa destructor]XP_022647248.1 protein FAM8A1-like isoform X1 [Varroa destructor]
MPDESPNNAVSQGGGSATARENTVAQERIRTSGGPTSTASKDEAVQRQEYINSLNQWLWQCYHWQQVNSVVTSAMLHGVAQSGGAFNVNRGIIGTGQQVTVDATTQFQVNIPSIPKRLAAELIDCAILLVVKFIITYIAVDYFEIIDLPSFNFSSFSYDLRILQQDLLTYSVALESILDKWPILFLESVHRLVVILYETLAVWGMIGRGQTIGKYIMNIRVINCWQCETVVPGVLRVRVSCGVGLLWALLRATMKNCGVTFLFPVCVTAFFFQHNRAVYDQLCRTLVIEEPRNGPRIVVN